MKKCQNCGQELPDDAKVCDNCGEPVEITNEDRSENEAKPDNMQDVQTNNENTGNNNEAQQPADSANKPEAQEVDSDRKSTRLNSSHVTISYAAFCLKKKRRRAQRR